MKILYTQDNVRIWYPVGYHINNAMAFVNQVDLVIDSIKDFPTKNITVWCRGSSGAILAALLVNHLINKGIINIQINHVKKEFEKSHDRNQFPSESIIGCTHIIIDDIIETGDTIKAICYKMAEYGIETLDYLIISDLDIKGEYSCPELNIPIPKCLITNYYSTIVRFEEGCKKLNPSNLINYSYENKNK